MARNPSNAGSENALWVFGYGSLMWRPDFPYVSARHARIHGYHRAFCVLSHVHRGTPERPGLVLGLARGGSCRGMGFEVADKDRDAVVDALRAREQVTAVYREVTLPMRFEDGTPGRVQALAYVADPAHHQFAGRMELDEQAAIIAHGVGQSGHNPEYLENTVTHLRRMGIRDHGLEALLAAVRARLA